MTTGPIWESKRYALQSERTLLGMEPRILAAIQYVLIRLRLLILHFSVFWLISEVMNFILLVHFLYMYDDQNQATNIFRKDQRVFLDAASLFLSFVSVMVLSCSMWILSSSNVAFYEINYCSPLCFLKLWNSNLTRGISLSVIFVARLHIWTLKRMGVN